MIATIMTGLAPELAILAICLGLFAETCAGGLHKERAAPWLPWAHGVAALLAVASLNARGEFFASVYVVDGLSQFFKLLVLGGAFAVSLMTASQPGTAPARRIDARLFLALSTFGLVLACSAVELVTLFIALEISSWAVVAAVCLRGQGREDVFSALGAEAAAKYVFFNGVISAVAILGAALLLSGAGTTYVKDLGDLSTFAASPLAVAGLVMASAAALYKLACAPLHYWAPDAYEGAATEIAAFVAGPPKAAAAAVLARFVLAAGPGSDLCLVLAAIGAVSMTWGNLAALRQSEVKRILAYSGAAHAGYLMLGFAAGTPDGLAAVGFHSLGYLLMTLTAFWAASALTPDGGNLPLPRLDGLHARSVPAALALAAALLSLVGIPPFAGFVGKLFLFGAAWSAGFKWLAILAGVNTALSIFYYLNMLRRSWTVEPQSDPSPVHARLSSLGLALAGLVLLLGVLPAAVWNVAARAVGM